MKHLFFLSFFSIIFLTSLSMSSCGGSSNDKAEIDSLRNIISVQEQQLNNDEMFMYLINTSMDSIISADGNIILEIREGIIPPKQKMIQNLETFKFTIHNQRKKIAELQATLENQSSAHSLQMKQLLAKLTDQLNAKDAEIVRLQQLVENNKITIADLNRSVNSLKKDVSELKMQNKEQEEALIVQSNMMNEAYYIVATKKELKKMGIVGGGNLFKKSKLDLSSVDASKFKKIDIRETTVINIPGSKPKILTQAPTGSYNIRSSGSTSVLTIIDANSFWSVNNFLVIQY